MTWQPSLTIGGINAYSLLGCVGYGVAAILVGISATALGFNVVDRIVLVVLPPLVFLGTIRLARRSAGYERIVFYDCLFACVATMTFVAIVLRMPLASSLDLCVIGIGTFLVFGRLGCHRVGCCHGRPTSRRVPTVQYGRAHVARGFPRIWQDRSLVPLQVAESVVSAVLVVFAIICALHEPGAGAATWVVGYGLVRFASEDLRGDRDRRLWRGLSEAQRAAVVSIAVVAALRPQWWTLAGFIALISASSVIVWEATRRRERLLLFPSHVHELANLAFELPPMTSATTTLDVQVSCYSLPDGRLDLVLSRRNGFPRGFGRRLAPLLHSAAEPVSGRSPEILHVLLPPAA